MLVDSEKNYFSILKMGIFSFCLIFSFLIIYGISQFSYEDFQDEGSYWITLEKIIANFSKNYKRVKRAKLNKNDKTNTSFLNNKCNYNLYKKHKAPALVNRTFNTWNNPDLFLNWKVYKNLDPPVLRDFQNEDVILNLPSGYKVGEITWLSVWCRRFTVNFGDVYIPKHIKPPKRVVLPEFQRLAHGLKSGNITILDAKTFYIPNLHYDGAGPDAYFWAGKGSQPNSGGTKVPNEKGRTDVLKGYQGEDIEITLPGDMTVHDVDYLAVWCVAYKHNFGHVFIPKNIDVPPYLGQIKLPTTTTSRPYYLNHNHRHNKSSKQHNGNKMVSSRPNNKVGKGYTFSNCKELMGNNVQVQWEKSGGNEVQFKISAKIDDNQYVALGFSPVKGRSEMVGADAVVVYSVGEDSRIKFMAEDYFLAAKSQCDVHSGACPDSRIGGVNDVRLISGSRKDGILSVTFSRPIVGIDSSPINGKGKIDLDLTDNTNIFVAIGNLNVRKEVAYHYGERTSGSDDVRIDIDAFDDNTCKKGDGLTLASGTPSEKTLKPWDPIIIEHVQNFTARIGPTGGKRGYTPITGNPSWGIAWWINDLLIPEIYVERGKTYNFIIEGGNDPTNPSRYHPFYITSSDQGGYGQKSAEEQAQQVIYAGVDFDREGYSKPTGVGRYCEWEHKGVDKSKYSETFSEYKKTLQLACDDGEPGIMTWKVEEDTPDLLYYQCYTHNTLGWKIHVVNPGFRLRRNPNPSKANGSISISIYFVIFSVLANLLRRTLNL